MINCPTAGEAASGDTAARFLGPPNHQADSQQVNDRGVRTVRFRTNVQLPLCGHSASVESSLERTHGYSALASPWEVNPITSGSLPHTQSKPSCLYFQEIEKWLKWGSVAASPAAPAGFAVMQRGPSGPPA